MPQRPRDHGEFGGATPESARHEWRRARVAAGVYSPMHEISAAAPLVIHLATLITVEEGERGADKRGFGFHPLSAFVDHGPGGTGELLAMRLWAGNAGPVTCDSAGRGPSSSTLDVAPEGGLEPEFAWRCPSGAAPGATAT